MAWSVQRILCFISSLLSPGKAGSTPVELAFLFLAPSPEPTSGSKMCEGNTVILQKCTDYSDVALLEVIDRAASHLGISGNISGMQVLIKPNLISAKGTGLACTHPQFIKGLVVWCLEQGAKVGIGDSPAFGSGAGALRSLGILDSLLQMGVEIRDFSPKKNVTLRCGLKVGVAAAALDCDLFLNVPKVKAHNQMYVTLGLKNVFGIVRGMRKAFLHMSHGDSHHQFAEILVDLLGILPQNLTFIDGIEVMHRSGPIHGDSLWLQCIAAGANPVALDTAFMSLLELDEDKNPLLQEAKRRKLPGSRLEDLDFPLLAPSDFEGTGFEAPETLAPVRFSPFRFLSGQVKRIVVKMQPQ